MNLSHIHLKPKSFVALILGLTASMFITLIIISEAFLHYVVIPSDNFYKHLNFYETTGQADIAAFGDSRMSQSFIPDQSDAVNFAYASESFEQIATKIDYALGNKEINKILLQVEPHMFASYRFDGDRRDYQRFFAPDAPWKNQFHLQDPVLRGQLLDHWELFLKSKGKIPNRSIFNTDNGGVMIDSVMQFPLTSTDVRYTPIRIAEHTLTPAYAQRKTWEIMRNTIRKVKQRNIQLCLVSFPVTPVYQDAILKTPYTDEAFERLSALAKEESVLFFKHRTLYGDRYELFRNLDHLNLTGAKKFSEKIISDCGF